jgi:hypothetical protein
MKANTAIKSPLRTEETMETLTRTRPEILPLTNIVGAEALNYDITQLDDDALHLLERTLYDRTMLVIRNQFLNPDAQLAFTRRWGRCTSRPM